MVTTMTETLSVCVANSIMLDIVWRPPLNTELVS